MRLPWDAKNKVDRSDGKYHRERSDSLYHTARWTRLSASFRVSHPLCESCKAKGIIEPATCVDHIIPFPICADFFFDRSNLQSLCDKCNQEKGQRDKERIAEWKINHRQ